MDFYPPEDFSFLSETWIRGRLKSAITLLLAGLKPFAL